MTAKHRITLLFIASILLLTACDNWHAKYNQCDSDRNNTSELNKQLNSSLTTCQTTAAILNNSNSHLQTQNNMLTSQLNDTMTQRDDLEQKLADANHRLDVVLAATQSVGWGAFLMEILFIIAGHYITNALSAAHKISDRQESKLNFALWTAKAIAAVTLCALVFALIHGKVHV